MNYSSKASHSHSIKLSKSTYLNNISEIIFVFKGLNKLTILIQKMKSYRIFLTVIWTSNNLKIILRNFKIE